VIEAAGNLQNHLAEVQSTMVPVTAP